MPQNHLYILTGASRGMGLAMAQQLLRSGNTLICIARSANDDLATEARAAGVTIEQWQQDLSQGEQAAHRPCSSIEWSTAVKPCSRAIALTRSSTPSKAISTARPQERHTR